MSCAFFGDSIALGIALAAQAGCERHAVVGATPAAILTIASHYSNSSYDWAVISAGSNPARVLPARKTLINIRRRINARKVVWVLPVSPRRAATVASAAARWGDQTVSFLPAADRLHPRSYGALWRSIRRIVQ